MILSKQTTSDHMHVSKVVKILIFTMLFGIVWYVTDWSEVFRYVREASVVHILLFVLFHTVGLYLSSYKWAVISRWGGFELPLYFFFKAYVIGAFINNFLPSFVGGDTYRSLVLRSQSESLGSLRGFSSVVVDRLSGLLSIFILALVSSGLFLVVLGRFEPLIHVFVILFSVFCFLIFGFVLYRYGVVQNLWSRVLVHVPRSIRKKIDKLSFEQDAMEKYISRSRSLKLFALSVLFAFLGVALSNYMLFLAVGVEISIYSFLSVIFVISIIATLPVSIGNIGLKESAYIIFFGFFGVPVSACVAIVILSRILQLLVSFGALPLYLSQRNEGK